MDEEIAKQNTISCTDASTSTKSQLDNNRFRHHILQNFLLIWLDSNIEESSENYQNDLTQLRNIFNNINIFIKPDQCVDFLTDIVDQKVFMVVSETIGAQIISFIHDIPQLNAIYVFAKNEFRDEQWIKDWSKVKGAYAQVTSMCEALQQTTKQSDHDSISLSFVLANENSIVSNLDQLEPSFMYTQIFKEILLEMKCDEKSIENLILYLRDQYAGNEHMLSIIGEFAHEYRPQSSIWWYTRERFTYQILNQALRTVEADIIIKMGFYLRDLHHQIKELHGQQLHNSDSQLITVYRGQGLQNTDFEKLINTKGGLISFNNFLSTSKDRQVSLVFAESAAYNPDMVGILFVMTIDPSISSIPFALIDEVSYFKEEEVLFSMHTVFRISEIKKMNNEDRLYEVELRMTSDNDQQLCTLTNWIQKEIPGSTGWERLTHLLVKLNQFEKAEELCTMLLDQTFEEKEKAIVSNNLGCIKAYQGNYKEAISYCEEAMKIWQKTSPLNDPRLASAYQNIASVYRYMGEYSKASSLCEKALRIFENTPLPNDSKLAHSYYEIASVYDNIGKYEKALLLYNKSLDIYQKTLPPNHPELASAYQRIGGVQNSMGEYDKALLSHNKAHNIYQKSLPSDHPSLAYSNNDIGHVYFNMEEYSKARSFYDKAFQIFERNPPSNHTDLASSYDRIGAMDHKMGNCSNALLSYEKALGIYQKAFPSNHPNLAITYNNIGAVYFTMEKYPQALSFYEKALNIYQKLLAPNQPDLAASYNNIGVTHRKMGRYSEALSFFNKALEILQNVFPSNHPNLAASYNNIGLVYMHMKKYSEALSWCNKALEICQNTHPPNLSLMATSYNYIYLVYCNIGNYSRALPFGERAFEILKRSLPVHHPDLQILQNNLDAIRNRL